MSLTPSPPVIPPIQLNGDPAAANSKGHVAAQSTESFPERACFRKQGPAQREHWRGNP